MEPRTSLARPGYAAAHGGLASTIADEGIRPPAVSVVGDVVQVAASTSADSWASSG